MGEINNRAHQLKKEQERAALIGAKIKVQYNLTETSEVRMIAVKIQDYAVKNGEP